MPEWTLHQGDALTLLPALSITVDAVICDPPYNSGGRTNAERRAQGARDKYVSGDAQHTLADFDGDTRDQRSYTHWLGLILAESYRLTRPGAAPSYSPTGRSFPRPATPCRPPGGHGAASSPGASRSAAP